MKEGFRYEMFMNVRGFGIGNIFLDNFSCVERMLLLNVSEVLVLLPSKRESLLSKLGGKKSQEVIQWYLLSVKPTEWKMSCSFWEVMFSDMSVLGSLYMNVLVNKELLPQRKCTTTTKLIFFWEDIGLFLETMGSTKNPLVPTPSAPNTLLDGV